MIFTRSLKYQFPLMSGEDVYRLQQRLLEYGFTTVGQPDSIFGPQTDAAVRAFQKSQNLKVDGVSGPLTWEALFQDVQAEPGQEKLLTVLEDLKQVHGFRDSVLWQLTTEGICIDGKNPENFGGDPQTVRRVWRDFKIPIKEWSLKFGVPAELIIATICTESYGKPESLRKEPGYISDDETPQKISLGLMQTLLSTAAATLRLDGIDRNWLIQPENSIRAGTGYIAQQWRSTHFDPPKVACAYNAGGIYYNNSPTNRWKMRQYPISSAKHADRFVKWFNECFLMFKRDHVIPTVSFFRLLATS